MGMSIDDCIKELLINKEDDTYVLGNETIDFAIDTMRKYQKIKQIIEVWHQDIFAKDFECIAEVAEVIENGNEH